ncbi:uncharacterized protein LOC124812774 isoform X1 [Hydra vulgaris]|uniref:uncharacterized protein LOC124812774 isoform X1 n=1 Tax=Hydra vulgaris TaxID=6087 RepID=UPI0032E9C362
MCFAYLGSFMSVMGIEIKHYFFHVCYQLHKCLTYVTLYTFFFFTFTVALISSAVPSATVSTAVPPATVSTAVPPATISAGPSASYQDFLQYRSQHPGPISSRAFYRWSQYGGDDPSFRWRREAPYDTTGRRRGAGKQFNSFNFYQ